MSEVGLISREGQGAHRREGLRHARDGDVVEFRFNV
jgi:hypothetical protein